MLTTLTQLNIRMISDENNFQYVDKIILDDLISDYVCQTLP